MNSRFRTRGALVPAECTKVDFNPDGSVYSTYVQQSASHASGSVETITDVSIPGFKKRRSQGQVFMNPVTQTSDMRSGTPSNWQFGPLPVWGKRVITGDCACMVSVPYSWPSTNEREQIHRDNAIIKANAKVGSSVSMGLVSIAEAGKTAKMLRHPFESARSLLDKMDSHRFSEIQKGKTAVKAAGSAWMEFRLGWKPVLYDIQTTMDAYQGLSGQKTTRLVARASSGYDESRSDEIAAVNVFGVQKVRTSRTNQRTYKAAVGVLYEFTETASEEKLRRFGLRLSDVPSSVWELVYASWVIDRFVNVGRWLDAITPKPGVKVLGSWMTETKAELNTHNVLEATLNVNVAGTTYPLSATGGMYSEVIRSKVRTVDVEVPYLPSVNPSPQTLAQMIDEVVLISSRLKIFDVKLPSRRKVISKPRQ